MPKPQPDPSDRPDVIDGEVIGPEHAGTRFDLYADAQARLQQRQPQPSDAQTDAEADGDADDRVSP